MNHMILGYTKGTHCLFSVLCFLLCIARWFSDDTQAER